ncbi:MAG: hypothetical protein EHM45_02795 [Desulfobacteraceae bacterium]|nr:MAG: hypothetical protein EHM45_02795 [Desulfobacteraceae bacterium]
MTQFLIQYPFFSLDLLMAVPVLVLFLFREDLRRPMRRMALWSLPFALTECLFYPRYWDPPVLFDSIAYLGFSLEDFLFVALLGMLSAFSYAGLSRSGYKPLNPCFPTKKMVRKGALIIGSACLAAIFLVYWGLPAIYAAVGCMECGTILILLFVRKDLRRPALYGGLATLAVYTLIALVLNLIIPGVFTRFWHTEELLNHYFAGIPIEELLYAFSAGFAATVFYPFVYSLKFFRKVSA